MKHRQYLQSWFFACGMAIIISLAAYFCEYLTVQKAGLPLCLAAVVPMLLLVFEMRPRWKAFCVFLPLLFLFAMAYSDLSVRLLEITDYANEKSLGMLLAATVLLSVGSVRHIALARGLINGKRNTAH